MANHKSSLKRIRQDKAKALHNRYYAKTMRNAVRKLRAMTDKEEAVPYPPSKILIRNFSSSKTTKAGLSPAAGFGKTPTANIVMFALIILKPLAILPKTR